MGWFSETYVIPKLLELQRAGLGLLLVIQRHSRQIIRFVNALRIIWQSATRQLAALLSIYALLWEAINNSGSWNGIPGSEGRFEIPDF